MQSVIVKKKPQGGQKKRLIVAVSKKEFSRAVDRNKAKRRIRAIFKEILEKTTDDFFVIPNHNVLTVSFEELKKEIHNKIHRYV